MSWLMRREQGHNTGLSLLRELLASLVGETWDSVVFWHCSCSYILSLVHSVVEKVPFFVHLIFKMNLHLQYTISYDILDTLWLMKPLLYSLLLQSQISWPTLKVSMCSDDHHFQLILHWSSMAISLEPLLFQLCFRSGCWAPVYQHIKDGNPMGPMGCS